LHVHQHQGKGKKKKKRNWWSPLWTMLKHSFPQYTENISLVQEMAQCYSTCLTCLGPWVWSLALKQTNKNQ
jgi:hypothetical protein